MEKRTQKQLIIGFVFILILGGIAYGIVDSLFLAEATCFDEIHNGKEEGVDCGTLACGFVCQEPVKPLQVSSEKLFTVGSGDYDFIAKIVNLNTVYGSSDVKYSVALPGVGIKTGTTYILPGQTKYIVLTSIKTKNEIASAGLKINSVEWEKLNMPAEGVNLVNRRGHFANSDTESSYEGIVYNDSNYDFDKVEVSVILFDSSNSVIGVNRTEIRTFLSKTERSFKISWPFALLDVKRTDVQISTNLFENSNFIKSYGTQERFQEFY